MYLATDMAFFETDVLYFHPENNTNGARFLKNSLRLGIIHRHEIWHMYVIYMYVI